MRTGKCASTSIHTGTRFLTGARTPADTSIPADARTPADTGIQLLPDHVRESRRRPRHERFTRPQVRFLGRADLLRRIPPDHAGDDTPPLTDAVMVNFAFRSI